MNSRLLKTSALVSSLLLAAGFLYYRTTLADQPANAPASQAANQQRTIILSGSKSAAVIPSVTAGTLNTASQPTSAPTTQPPATAPTPEQIELQRRLLIMSSSKSSGVISPDDLKRRLQIQQQSQPNAPKP